MWWRHWSVKEGSRTRTQGCEAVTGMHRGVPARWRRTPMIVALFSDVHGNLPALELFLSKMEGVADRFICLGDVVDYGPWNDECLERIAQLPNVSMPEGNHERLFLGE